MAETTPAPAKKTVKKKAVAKKKKKKPGAGAARTLAALALLASLAALGVSGWLWWRLDLQAGLGEARLPERLDALEARWGEVARGMAQHGARLEDLAERQTTLERSLSDLRAELGRGRQDWVLEEVAQLLLVANTRVRLGGDLDTALAALQEADRRLEALAEPGLLALRKQINDEITALQTAPRPDIAGITLKLGSLARSVDRLPLATRAHFRTVEETPAAAAPAPPPDRIGRLRALLAEIWGDLKTLVTVRRIEARRPPLLPESQRYFLYENLRLMLNGAQLAALRADQAAYRHDLETAAAWLKEYFDTREDNVRRVMAELETLAAHNLTPELPDISGSLEALRALQKGAAAKRGRSE